MKPDPERVARLSAEILDRLEKLAAYTAIPFADFQADERTVLAVKMLMVEAVEGAAALCNHLMARKFRQAPGGFSSSIGWHGGKRERCGSW